MHRLVSNIFFFNHRSRTPAGQNRSLLTTRPPEPSTFRLQRTPLPSKGVCVCGLLTLMIFDGPLPFEAEAAVPLRFPQGICQRARGCCASPEKGGQASGQDGPCACGAWQHHMRMLHGKETLGGLTVAPVRSLCQACQQRLLPPRFLKATLRPSNTAYRPGPPGQKLQWAQRREVPLQWRASLPVLWAWYEVGRARCSGKNSRANMRRCACACKVTVTVNILQPAMC